MHSAADPPSPSPSGPGRFVPPIRVAPPRRSTRDWNTVRRTWGRAFNDFDARVSAIVSRSKDAPARAAGNPALEWCIACLRDVRAALYDLHMEILNEHLPLTQGGPAIVDYLSEAYVWSGDTMGAVEALVQDLREGSADRDFALAEDSGSYVRDFLGPLFDKVCSARGSGAHPTRALLALVERLHVAIESLNWALRAS